MNWLKQDWETKLVALILATLLWWAVNFSSPSHVISPPGGWSAPTPAPATTR